MMPVGKRFLRYCHKVFGLSEFLRSVKLGSPAPRRIPAWSKLLTMLIGIWTRRGSLHRLEQLMKAGRFKRLLGVKSPISADTLGRALNGADARLLREYNRELIRKARHNKVFGTGTIEGWMVVALDGTQTYTTQRPPKAAVEGWKRRHLANKPDVTEHYEMAIGLSYVGSGPPLVLSLDRIKRGEGEVAAGLRQIQELDEQLGWSWCDVVCADALYAGGPFINEVRARHKHVIVRAKDSLRIVKDAQGLFEHRPPDDRMEDATPRLKQIGTTSTRYQVEIWDEEGFTTWESVKEPLRCIRVRQVREEYRNSRWIAGEPKDSFIITTIPQAQMNAKLVWRIMHQRWDIENSLFNDLKQNWAFEHCYTHDVRGIEALYALYAIAFNLKLLFAYRQLGYRRKRGPTLVELGDLFLMDFGTCSMSWWEVLTWRRSIRAGPT